MLPASFFPHIKEGQQYCLLHKPLVRMTWEDDHLNDDEQINNKPVVIKLTRGCLKPTEISPFLQPWKYYLVRGTEEHFHKPSVQTNIIPVPRKMLCHSSTCSQSTLHLSFMLFLKARLQYHNLCDAFLLRDSRQRGLFWLMWSLLFSASMWLSSHHMLLAWWLTS